MVSSYLLRRARERSAARRRLPGGRHPGTASTPGRRTAPARLYLTFIVRQGSLGESAGRQGQSARAGRPRGRGRAAAGRRPGRRARARPAAAAGPDAGALDTFLAQHASPMTGSGATFVREGQEHGVDPVFLVAIAGAETSFGAFLYSESGDQCTYNAFNWFYGPTWPTRRLHLLGRGDRPRRRGARAASCITPRVSSRSTPSLPSTALTAPSSGSPTSRRS